MAENSNIEWTDSSFNPWRGCQKVSPGCANCYAETLSRRNHKTLGVWGPNGTRVVASEAMWREPLKWNAAAAKAGVRAKVFCASLADVFEGPETMPHDAWQQIDGYARYRLWATIWCTPKLDWLLLTKRPENIVGPKHHIWAPGALANATGWVQTIAGSAEAQRFYSATWPPHNVWLGTSVENQEQADKRIPELLKVPAAIRFLSVEPLLGSVDLSGHFAKWTIDPGIHWVIIGGESGPGRRDCDPAWIASIVEQCKVAGVACFVKQDAAAKPAQQGRISLEVWQHKDFPRVNP